MCQQSSRTIWNWATQQNIKRSNAFWQKQNVPAKIVRSRTIKKEEKEEEEGSAAFLLCFVDSFFPCERMWNGQENSGVLLTIIPVLAIFTNTQKFVECFQHLKMHEETKSDSFVNKSRWYTEIRVAIWRMHKLAHVVGFCAAFFSLLVRSLNIRMKCTFAYSKSYFISLKRFCPPSLSLALRVHRTLCHFFCWGTLTISRFSIPANAFLWRGVICLLPILSHNANDHLSTPNWLKEKRKKSEIRLSSTLDR